MAQRRVPQETSTSAKQSRKAQVNYAGTYYFGVTGTVSSPTEMAEKSMQFMGLDGFSGATQIATISYSGNSWVGLVGMEVYGGVGVSSIRVNGSPVTGFSPGGNTYGARNFGRVEVLDYGPTVTVSLTANTQVRLARAMPDKLVNSDHEILWPKGLSGEKVYRDW